MEDALFALEKQLKELWIARVRRLFNAAPADAHY